MEINIAKTMVIKGFDNDLVDGRVLNPAMKGKRVCYLHGGKSPAPPKNNINALKHGFYTAEVFAERRYIKSLIKRADSMIKKLKG